LNMTNASGDVIIRDGIANLSNLEFNTLGGRFVVNGTYNTQDVTKPAYDFKMVIKDLSIGQSFEAFSMVKKYAPLAKNMIGNVSTDLNISGLLKQDMMPDFGTINAKGILDIAQAAIAKPLFVSKIANVTNLKSSADSDVSFKDVAMSATIKDGKLSVKPFNIKIGDYKTNVSGVSTVDGKLDYKMDMEIPAGSVGTKVNSFLSQYTGSGNSSSTIKLPLKVGGSYDAPTFNLLEGGVKQQATSLVKTAAKTTIKEKTGVDIDTEKEKQRENILKESQTQADNLIAEGKRTADKVREEGYAQADKLVKEAGSNFFKKKIAEEAAKKLRSQTDKKAQFIEDEAKKKADSLLSKAQEKAAAL